LQTQWYAINEQLLIVVPFGMQWFGNQNWKDLEGKDGRMVNSERKGMPVA
jgi:hypothetical protein